MTAPARMEQSAEVGGGALQLVQGRSQLEAVAGSCYHWRSSALAVAGALNDESARE